MKDQVLNWISEWETLINEVNYEKARPLFSDNVVAFGTVAGYMKGLKNLEDRQWRKVWPTIKNFEFDRSSMTILGDSNSSLKIVLMLWRSLGKTGDGGWYERRGRVTLALKQKVKKMECVHSHFSMEPGIPPLSPR